MEPKGYELLKIETKIDALENIEEGIALFIKDNETNVYHDLRVSDFEFELPQGIYNSKFSLVFHNLVLAIDDEKVLENEAVIFMNNSTSEIQIINNKNLKLNKVALYNTLGQQTAVWNINSSDSKIVLPVFNISTGVYFVNAETEGVKIATKIIIE